jgi:hypothetical protein
LPTSSCSYNGNNLGLVARDKRWWRGQWWCSEINGGGEDSGGALGVKVFFAKIKRVKGKDRVRSKKKRRALK